MPTYISTTEADSYFASRLGNSDAWMAEIAQHLPALELASKLIDSQRFKGRVSTYSQELAWPRIGVCDSEGRPVPHFRVPDAVRYACAEWALALLQSPDGYQTKPAISRERIGESDVSFVSTIPDELPAKVRLLLTPYLDDSLNGTAIAPH